MANEVSAMSNRRSKRRTTATFFSFVVVLLYGFSLYYSTSDANVSSSLWPAPNTSGFFFGVLLMIAIAALLVVAVRATVVTWITVLVLLAFAGKRRRSLVREGRKITTDITMYAMKIVLKERSLIAISFAVLSFIALVQRRESIDLHWG
ncbi:hypothetical protein BVC80_1065g164 [Macleaya cordata]|uniref:Uncharacterized protein n=1 Tax=Macleaya cordata TaxID=56857 RepID=A0A200RD32_MACCD|nr:hypothetical protein BVC80_1065g164 [Macleaya cordata]